MPPFTEEMGPWVVFIGDHGSWFSVAICLTGLFLPASNMDQTVCLQERTGAGSVYRAGRPSISTPALLHVLTVSSPMMCLWCRAQHRVTVFELARRVRDLLIDELEARFSLLTGSHFLGGGSAFMAASAFDCQGCGLGSIWVVTGLFMPVGAAQGSTQLDKLGAKHFPEFSGKVSQRGREILSKIDDTGMPG